MYAEKTKKFYKPTGILKTTAKVDVVSLASLVITGVGFVRLVLVVVRQGWGGGRLARANIQQ